MAISPDDAIKRAEALARRGETQQARQLYQALLEKNPADARARGGLVALDHYDAKSGTPSYKSIPVQIRASAG